MNRPSRVKNILNGRENLWVDSESETSSLSENENPAIQLKNSDSSSDENNPPTCCLICSILPNLSTINTCEKHLALLTKARKSTQVVYMMPPAITHCHCRGKSKHRCRSSSSETESEHRHSRKKRSMTVQSSDTSSPGDLFFSPNVQSQENQPHRSNHVQARLSPSLPPSSTISTNKHYNELLLAPFLQRNSHEIEPILENPPLNSPDVIEIDSDLSCSPRISLHQIVHVKDEDDILNDTDQKKVMINMAQATEEMLNHEYPQPIILLKRICLEK